MEFPRQEYWSALPFPSPGTHIQRKFIVHSQWELLLSGFPDKHILFSLLLATDVCKAFGVYLLWHEVSISLQTGGYVTFTLMSTTWCNINPSPWNIAFLEGSLASVKPIYVAQNVFICLLWCRKWASLVGHARTEEINPNSMLISSWCLQTHIYAVLWMKGDAQSYQRGGGRHSERQLTCSSSLFSSLPLGFRGILIDVGRVFVNLSGPTPIST